MSWLGLPRWLSGRESACQCRRRGFDPWSGKIFQRRKFLPTPVFLFGGSQGWRRLVGYSSVQLLSCVWLFATPWTATRQASLSIANLQSLLKLMSIELVMPLNHLIPFSFWLQSFPASGFFQMSQLFASGGQSIGVSASASVLPMNIQDRFPLGWTGWISLQSKGHSRIFNITAQKHQFFGTQLSL